MGINVDRNESECYEVWCLSFKMHVVQNYKPKYMFFFNFPKLLKMMSIEQKLFIQREVLYFHYTR